MGSVARFEPFPAIRYDLDRVSLPEVVSPPYDVINTAENVLRDSEGPYTTHIQAIREYAKHEILRGGE